MANTTIPSNATPANHTMTEDEFCANVPCAYIGGTLVSQPSSTAIVFVLGLMFFCGGCYLLCTHKIDGVRHWSRIWWGLSQTVWGISVFFAGVSFQAFTYQLDCVGQYKCKDADWAALTYYALQNCGIQLFIVARAYRACRRHVIKAAIYSGGNAVLYAALLAFGGPPFRVYEVSLVFMAPSFFILIGLNLFCIHDKILYCAWGALGGSFVWMQIWKYAVPWREWYDAGGGWFSENDALHVGNMIFVIFAFWSVLYVQDAPEGSSFQTYLTTRVRFYTSRARTRLSSAMAAGWSRGDSLLEAADAATGAAALARKGAGSTSGSGDQGSRDAGNYDKVVQDGVELSISE